MKKFCFLFVIFCSIFLINTNVSALEPSEVTDDNIMQYIEENYSSYFQDYYFLVKYSNKYTFISSDIPIFLSYNTTNQSVTFKPLHPTSAWIGSVLTLNISDNLSSVYPSQTNKSMNAYSSSSMFNLGFSSTYENIETFRSYFIYSNYDIYGTENKQVLDILLVEKTKEDVEPEPSPEPEPSAPTEGVGEVSSSDIITLYMNYFLLGLPVALIMITFENIGIMFYDFILGKMRR